MSKKDTQRKTLAMLVLFFITYIYVEKVANPFFLPEQAKPPAAPVGLVDDRAADVEEVFSNDDVTKAEEQGSSTLSLTSSQNVSPNSSKLGSEPGSKLPGIQAGTSDSVPSSAEVKMSGTFSIENDFIKVMISRLGGRIISLQLKDYRQKNPEDPNLVEMISFKEGMAHPGALLVGSESDTRTLYEVEFIGANGTPITFDESLTLGAEQAELKAILTGVLPSGRTIQKSLSFTKESYVFKLGASLLEQAPDSILIEWPKLITSKDTSFFDPYDTDGFVWIIGDRSERLTYSDMTKEQPEKRLEGLKWLGFGNKYFATALVYKPSNGKSEVVLNNTADDTSNVKNGVVQLPPTKAKLEKRGRVSRALFGESAAVSNIELEVFSGPKSYPLLEEVGYDLKRLIDLGKSGIISAPLLLVLNLFYKFVGNYGLAIVLLTIAVKLILYPLNSTQFKQMKSLQALKPELDRIKENIKDRQQQQQAMMELYKKKGVNPLGGCLPVLVQMPIFIGLYSALMLSVELRHAPFGLWVQDLSAPDSLVIAGIGIPVLVVLFTASMMVQQWITPTTIDPAQKKAMMIMPIIMFFMFMGFPAGLALYWLTNNLFSIGQQQAIQYNDKHGKSGFKITAMVAVGVFAVAWLCTLF